MKNKFFLAALLICFFVTLLSQIALANYEKVDLMNGIRVNKISVSQSSEFDYGLLNSVFDGNPNTFASYNRGDTFAITLEFYHGTPLVKTKFFTKSPNASWTFEAAGSLFELNYKQGEYVKVADKKAIEQSKWDSLLFEEQNYYACRLTVFADSGDISINEWELFADYQILDISLTPKEIELRPSWQKTVKLNITSSIGTFQMSIDEITRFSNNPNIARILPDNQIVGVAPGETEIIVNYAGFSDSCKVLVKEGKRSTDPGDLAVKFIKRLPTMNYVWGSENPKVDGWPQVGQEIAWLALIKNFSKNDIFALKYRWYIDDEIKEEGQIDIAAFSIAEILLPDLWTGERQRIKLVIDPESNIEEEEKANNELEIYSDALSLALYVEESVYNHFRENQFLLEAGSNCWDDWAQRQIRICNAMLENAIYPATPNGVIDRLRLDNIAIVPDSALPLAGGMAENTPNLYDKTVDLIWGFPASLLSSDWYSKLRDLSTDNPFYYEGSLFHELGHARYLIDIYGFNVHDDANGSSVAIKEDDELIVGSKYMPFLAWDCVHYTPIKGLMNVDFTFIDEYSAIALNMIEHQRAIYGNYNAPGNIGIFMNDIPKENILIVKDSLGSILSNAEISIYQAKPLYGIWYGKHFENKPDTVFLCDENGAVRIGNMPFTKETSISPSITHDYGWSNGTIILRVEHEGRIGYTFFESSLCNLSYWQGDSIQAEFEIMFPLFEHSKVEEARSELSHSIAPNPATNYSILHFYTNSFNNCLIKIFDEFGKTIEDRSFSPENLGKQSILLDFDQYSTGNYFYIVQSEKINYFGKFIVIK